MTTSVFAKTLAAAAVAGVVAFAAPVSAASSTFLLANETGLPIYRIQVSPTWSNVWGPDLLGRDVLPVHETAIVRPGGNDCHYDVRVTFRNGATRVVNNMDACRVTTLTFR